MPNRGKDLSHEIRKDYIQEKYVVIAPRRAKRPHVIKNAKEPEAPPSPCVLCPEKLDKEKSQIMAIGGGKGEPWRIKVVRNKYPSVAKRFPKAYGAQEVIVETPHPAKQIEEFSEAHIAELLGVYASRTEEVSLDPRIQYLIIFKNNGGRAGASITHSHSQIFASDFIPPHLVDKSKKAFEYRLHNGTCPYCDVLASEMDGPRRIYADEHVVAFAPYASMHNYEVWILPRRHVDNITGLSAGERRSWARVLKRVLRAIVKLGLPYNYYFHQVVHDRDQHLYMKVTPRGNVWAGLEIGSGVIINAVAPEDAARYYREQMALG